MRRVLLKLSGEALSPGGEAGGFGIDPEILDEMATEIGALVAAGGQLAVVLGGGNLFRGAALQAAGMDRVTGDHMGMLATIMNGLAFRDLLERRGIAAATVLGAAGARGCTGLRPGRRGYRAGGRQGRRAHRRYRQPVLHDRHGGMPESRRGGGRTPSSRQPRWTGFTPPTP